MSSSGSDAKIPGSWTDYPKPEPRSSESASSRQRWQPPTSYSSTTDSSQPGPNAQSSRRTHWPPRQCRICLDVVQPTFDVPSEHLPGFLQSPGNVKYEDESGRLIRPCLCKGSAKYVHEGCLQAWRHADPGYGRRNYWQCPTCHYKYRLARLGAGKFVGSTSKSIRPILVRHLLTKVFSCSSHNDRRDPHRSRFCSWLYRRSYHQPVFRPLELPFALVKV